MKDTILLAANVDSGAPQRLVQHLSERGLDCRIVAEFSADAYRTLMASGPGGRRRARLRSMLIYPLRVLLRVLREHPRWVIATTNPLILPMVLVATRPFHRARVVGLLYDLFPDGLQITHGISPRNLGYRVTGLGTRFWLRHADAVVFLGERMAEYTEEVYGGPRRSAIIGVGADPREFEPAVLGDPAPSSELERWCEGRVVASYVGNLGLSHDWETLAEAVPRALERSDLRCVVCAWGPGVDALRHAWRSLPSDRIRFEPSLPDRDWARLLTRSALSLVTAREEAVRIPIGFPSKMFSAMAAGSAIVAVGPAGSDAARTVDRYQCGVSIMPGDVEGLAQALAGLASDPKQLAIYRDNARRAALEDFDLRELARRWHQLLEELPPLHRRDSGYETAKRIIDVVAAVAGLVALAPLLGVVAACIRTTMGSPVLFRHQRAGQGGQPFDLVKFRTMRHPLPGEEGPEHDVSRLTRLGRWLRATSIDELPALWNVLRGDMSLVGPRPLVVRYLGRYTRLQARRHDVKPGITGWAQINGRNALSWEAKLALDVEYVERRSLRWDLVILAKTVWKVVRADGVSQHGHATMSEFLGVRPGDRHDA